jgi:hypothetical protein
MAAQAKGLKGYRKVIMALGGAILIVFGAVWMTAILPSMMKVPADLSQTQTLVGTVQIADQTGALSAPIPVTRTRQQTGIATESNNVLIVEEVSTFTNTVTGEAIPFMPPITELIAIERSSLEMVSSESANMERTGLWSPPTSLAAGDTFMLWNPGAEMPLQATYVRSEEFEGLDVVVFQLSENNLALGQEVQEIAPGTTMTLDKYYTTEVTLWIEPTAGVVVDTDSTTTISYALPGMDPVPAAVNIFRYTEGTIASYVDTAKSALSQLFLFGTLIPWAVIGCGAVVLATPLTIIAMRKLRKTKVEEPAEIPTPSSLPFNN